MRLDRPLVTEFGRSVTNLTGQIRSFQTDLANEDAKVLVGDAHTYEVALEQLYSYAEKQNIDLDQYYHQLISITDSLQSAKRKIQQKADNVEQRSDYSLLMQCLGSINTALRLASGLTNLAYRR